MMVRVVLYDGECGLCGRFLRVIRFLDKKNLLTYLPLQHESAEKIREATNGENLSTVVYVKDEKNIFIKSDAIISILVDLQGIFRGFLILKLIPKSLRDFVYLFVARNRHHICSVKGGP